MNNNYNVSNELLSGIDNLVKQAGVNPEEFVKCLANFYNVEPVNDFNAYWDSFTA